MRISGRSEIGHRMNLKTTLVLAFQAQRECPWDGWGGVSPAPGQHVGVATWYFIMSWRMDAHCPGRILICTTSGFPKHRN